MLVQSEHDDIQIAVPEEGAALSFDDMAIPNAAKQVELAHKFIDFVLDPQVAAELTEFIYFLCPNAASYGLLSEEIRSDPILFPPPEVVAKLEMIGESRRQNVQVHQALGRDQSRGIASAPYFFRGCICIPAGRVAHYPRLSVRRPRSKG
jgi:spermidine/putrescine-binding protein